MSCRPIVKFPFYGRWKGMEYEQDICTDSRNMDGGWAWQDVVRHLSRRGHIAHTPTLAGHGRGAMPRGITHEDCVDSVVACIRHCNLENVVLVGHSFGGTVVQRVAARVPERIVRLVFVNALFVKDKERVFDILPEVFLDSHQRTAFNNLRCFRKAQSKFSFPLLGRPGATTSSRTPPNPWHARPGSCCLQSRVKSTWTTST